MWGTCQPTPAMAQPENDDNTPLRGGFLSQSTQCRVSSWLVELRQVQLAGQPSHVQFNSAEAVAGIEALIDDHCPLSFDSLRPWP